MQKLFNNSERGGHFKSGAVLSYLTLGTNCIVSIFFTPFMIRILGESEYGLYQMIGSFAGYLSILDMGMSSAVTKYVSKYYRKKERKKEENFLALMFVYYTFISIIVLISGYTMYQYIDNIFSNTLSGIELIKAKKMFIILIFNLVLTLYGGIFRGIMSAYEYFFQTKGAEFIRVVVRVAMIYGLLLVGKDSIGLVITDTVLNFIFCIYRMLFCMYKIRSKFHYYGLDICELKEITFFSFFVFLNLVFDQLNWKIDQMIIGMKISTSAVTVYSIGMNFSNYFMNFSIAVKSLFLPKVIHMEVEGADGGRYTEFLVRTGKMQGYLLFYLYFAFLFMGRQFIHIIMGKDYYEAWLSAVLVMSGLLIPLLQNAGHPILQAKNKHHIYVIVCLLISIANAGCTWLVIEKLGILGAAFMTMLSFIAGQAVFLSWYYQKKLGIDMKSFFSEIYKANIKPIVWVVIVEIVINSCIMTDKWWKFIIHGIGYSFIYLISIVKLGMNKWEKEYIFGFLKKYER